MTSTDAIDARILVRIVSYRDAELLRTIASAWQGAVNADRVHFAIVNQFGPETEDQLTVLQGDKRVVSFQTPWHSARGLGWARRLTDRMYGGQEFTLQADAHTRFTQGWDQALIEQWQRCDDRHAVLSCYPGAFINVDDKNAQYVPAVPHQIVLEGYDADGLPQLNSGLEVDGGTRAYLVSGGFQFSAGQVCAEVEQARDPMTSDEYVHSLRLFTHGWNVYAPETVPLMHLYRQDKDADAPDFLKDFESTPETRQTLARLQKRNVDTTLAICFGDGGGLLGNARTRDEFDQALADISPFF